MAPGTKRFKMGRIFLAIDKTVFFFFQYLHQPYQGHLRSVAFEAEHRLSEEMPVNVQAI